MRHFVGDGSAAGQHLAGLGFQLFHGAGAGAAYGLVRRDDEAPHPAVLVQGPDDDDHDDGRAVRVGDDAVVGAQIIGIDLGHDERHVRIHAERRGVVDDDGTCLEGMRDVLLAHRAAGRGQDDVDPCEGVCRQFLNRQRVAFERHGFAGGTRRGQQTQLVQRKIAFVE